MSPVVRCEVGDGIATVTLDSPANRNALSAALRRELIDAVDAAIADPAVRVIVLTHTGPVFCAGMDLRESRGASAGDQGVLEFPRILDTIWTAPKPVVARLTGAARAGGIGLMAVCDLVVTSDATTFGFSEVRLGLVPAVISPPVVRRIAPAVAHALFLTGETFDATRAQAIGLVDRAVPPDQVDVEVDRLVRTLLLGAPGALAGVKQLGRASLMDELERLTEVSAGYFAGAEGQEGLMAYANKRPPVWQVIG